jgi:hypothetical protein
MAYFSLGSCRSAIELRPQLSEFKVFFREAENFEVQLWCSIPALRYCPS